MIAIAAFLAGVGIWWYVRRLPVSSDPWESELSRDDVENCENALCTKCLAPVESPLQHYCPRCANITGQFTGYIPFVNIPFQYSIYETLWKKIEHRQDSRISRIIAVIFILIFAPIILLVGIPILLYRKIKKQL